MTAKQSVWENLTQLRQKAQDRPMELSAVLERVTRAGVRLLLCAVVSSVTVLNGQAPLGVAMTAASGSGYLHNFSLA
ncbi:MAG: hypothetical protein IKA29_04160 [Clostridia bacterium]|nr:hypothetical protein [Clostridia bacterium]